MGDRLRVGHRTLTPVIVVRIHVPQQKTAKAPHSRGLQVFCAGTWIASPSSGSPEGPQRLGAQAIHVPRPR